MPGRAAKGTGKRSPSPGSALSAGIFASIVQPALVAVSGGRDSIVLLHALVAAGFRELIVCHLDHSLRTESTEDAAFVEEIARGYDLPFVIETTNVKKTARERKLSLEAAARECRYAFFARAARECCCPRVVLAHHADDQVETLLLNLFRGSGRAGLGAMRPISFREVDGARLELHRPLLGVWRDELATYARSHELAFREDASNTDPRFTRNRLRHSLLPVLEDAFGREVKRALWRTAEILGSEEEWIANQTPHVAPEPLRATRVKALPVAIQRRVLHAWLRAHAIVDVSFEKVEAVRALLTDSRRAKTNLAEGRHARRRSGLLFIEP